MLEQALGQLEKQLILSRTALLNTASLFREHMDKGLSGHESSLRMLPSHLGRPSGDENGIYLGLDLGGSHARVSLIKLDGNGRLEELCRQKQALVDSESGHDYRAESVTAEELFDFLAGLVQEVLTNPDTNPKLTTEVFLSRPIPLGFAFSFPFRQRKIDEGILLKWDKEVRTSGVVGKDVGQLLSAALQRRELHKLVKPAAIMNDTTATFLSAAYQDPGVDMASIIGTGHNTCYLERTAEKYPVSMIVNTESGNFSVAPRTEYDLRLDRESDNPGEQRFEKMLSGKYLGEIWRQISLDFSARGLLNPSEFPATWDRPYAVSGKDLAWVAAGNLSTGLQRIAQLLIKRSAQLVAAGLIGNIWHQDPRLAVRHTVAIDGSVYLEMPDYAPELRMALQEGLETKVNMVTVKAVKGGTLSGAVIAVAMVTSR